MYEPTVYDGGTTSSVLSIGPQHARSQPVGGRMMQAHLHNRAQPRHERKNFDGMDLVYVHEHSKPHRHGSAGHMKIELIKRCKTMSSTILNRLPGGEGAPRASPCFVYIAWRVNE